MITTITGPKGPAAAEKSRSKGKPAGAEGTSFAQMLEQAGQPAAAVSPGVVGYTPAFIPVDEEPVPQHARAQAQELLKTLQQLAEDAFTGVPTGAADKLDQLSRAVPVDVSTLTPTQQNAVNELQTRAAVEAAKLKS